MKAIEFHNVRFSYEKDLSEDMFFDAQDAFAIKGVNFAVEKGEFVAVLGHNGSGKSTLARLTNGLLKPTDGEVRVFGYSATEDVFEVRKKVGIVFQNPDNQTVASIVEDDVAFGPENVGMDRKEIGDRIDFALRAVGMEKYRYSMTSRLSGGQKQRIAIAGVLALKPDVMILDESTAMLDPKGRKEVVDIVERLNKEEGITVLLITHFPEEAMRADRAVVMHEGEIVLEGKPTDVLCDKFDLQRYALSVPKSVAVCQALREAGLAIEDTLSVEKIADALQKAVGNKAVEIGDDDLDSAMTTLVDTTLEADEKGRILAQNLHHTYDEKTAFATYALCGVSVDIRSGEFFGVLGHTGSGKSTFVQHLNALIKTPTAHKKFKAKKGFINQTTLRVNGFDLTDKHTDFQALRSKVGMVFQYPEYQLFAETVFEDVAFGLKNFGLNLSKEQTELAVKDALETVGLSYETYKNRSPFELSGGQKRRVAIAGVLVTKPEILVLDEPAAGLDPKGKEAIGKLLHDVHGKWCKTVVIVSHDMDEIAENCTRACIFEGGKITAVGTPKTLFEKGENSLSSGAGLGLPFVGELTDALQKRGVTVRSNYRFESFVQLLQALILRENGKGGAK